MRKLWIRIRRAFTASRCPRCGDKCDAMYLQYFRWCFDCFRVQREQDNKVRALWLDGVRKPRSLYEPKQRTEATR